MHLVGFIIRIYRHARLYERQIKSLISIPYGVKLIKQKGFYKFIFSAYLNHCRLTKMVL